MSIYNICQVMEAENNSEFVKSTLSPLRNLGIGITDDHIHQYGQYPQIWDSDGKNVIKYKLTLEKRLDKKHFGAVF